MLLPAGPALVGNSVLSQFIREGLLMNAKSTFAFLFAPLAAAACCVMPAAARAGQIFVASNDSNAVAEYDSSTGATVNASLITFGAGVPTAVALSGGNLFVESLS